MRISDWSSDVCSSDLHVYPFAIGGLADFLDIILGTVIDAPRRAKLFHRASSLVAARRGIHRMPQCRGKLNSGGAETAGAPVQIGREHDSTPVTNQHLVCRILLEKKNKLEHDLLRHSKNKQTKQL